MLIHDALQLREQANAHDYLAEPEQAGVMAAVPATPASANATVPGSPGQGQDPFPSILPDTSVMPSLATLSPAVAAQRSRTAPKAAMASPAVAAGAAAAGLAATAMQSGGAEGMLQASGGRWRKDVVAGSLGAATGGLIVPALFPNWFQDEEEGRRNTGKVVAAAALGGMLAIMCHRALL